MDESRRLQIEERILAVRRMSSFAISQNLANDTEEILAELKLRTESYNQCSAELRAANAKCDRLEQDRDTLNVLIANLKSQLAVSERISNDRNEARVAGLSEITQLRNDLAAAEIASKKNLDAHISANHQRELAWIETTGVSSPKLAREKIAEIVNERDALQSNLIAERRAAKDLLARHQVTVSDFNAACDERDSLRMKLETQTKIAVACQDAVDRAAREQVDRMKAIREGKLAERVAQVMHAGQQARARAVYGEGWKQAAAERLSDCSAEFRDGYMQDATNVLAELAQIPIDLPTTDEIQLTYCKDLHPHHTPGRVNAERVYYMLHNRLAALLVARNATKIELPTDTGISEEAKRRSRGTVNPMAWQSAFYAGASWMYSVAAPLIAPRSTANVELPTWKEIRVAWHAADEVDGMDPDSCAMRVQNLFRDKFAAHESAAIGLPSVEVMLDWFNVGRDKSTSSNKIWGGIYEIRDRLVKHFGLTEYAPSNTETVAPVEVSEPAPSLWDRFKKATGRTRQITDERPLYFSDLKALCELLDR